MFILVGAGTLSIGAGSVSMHLDDTRGAQWLVYSIDTPLSLFGLTGGSSHCVQGFLQQASAPHLPESNVHDFLLVEIQISAPCQRE